MMIDTILENSTLRQLLCADQAVNRTALLYEDIKKFETCEHAFLFLARSRSHARFSRFLPGSMPISHAHIIFQKYLAPDAPLFVAVSENAHSTNN
jgi:hypothetical protein